MMDSPEYGPRQAADDLQQTIDQLKCQIAGLLKQFEEHIEKTNVATKVIDNLRNDVETLKKSKAILEKKLEDSELFSKSVVKDKLNLIEETKSCGSEQKLLAEFVAPRNHSLASPGSAFKPQNTVLVLPPNQHAPGFLPPLPPPQQDVNLISQQKSQQVMPPSQIMILPQSGMHPSHGHHNMQPPRMRPPPPRMPPPQNQPRRVMRQSQHGMQMAQRRMLNLQQNTPQPQQFGFNPNQPFPANFMPPGGGQMPGYPSPNLATGQFFPGALVDSPSHSMNSVSLHQRKNVSTFLGQSAPAMRKRRASETNPYVPLSSQPPSSAASTPASIPPSLGPMTMQADSITPSAGSFTPATKKMKRIYFRLLQNAEKVHQTKLAAAAPPTTSATATAVVRAAADVINPLLVKSPTSVTSSSSVLSVSTPDAVDKVVFVSAPNKILDAVIPRVSQSPAPLPPSTFSGVTVPLAPEPVITQANFAIATTKVSSSTPPTKKKKKRIDPRLLQNVVNRTKSAQTAPPTTSATATAVVRSTTDVINPLLVQSSTSVTSSSSVLSTASVPTSDKVVVVSSRTNSPDSVIPTDPSMTPVFSSKEVTPDPNAVGPAGDASSVPASISAVKGILKKIPTPRAPTAATKESQMPAANSTATPPAKATATRDLVETGQPVVEETAGTPVPLVITPGADGGELSTDAAPASPVPIDDRPVPTPPSPTAQTLRFVGLFNTKMKEKLTPFVASLPVPRATDQTSENPVARLNLPTATESEFSRSIDEESVLASSSVVKEPSIFAAEESLIMFVGRFNSVLRRRIPKKRRSVKYDNVEEELFDEATDIPLEF